MDRKQLVFAALKPKVKALGFNKKELMGIAAMIADNLTSEEEASEEDVNAEIEKAIDAQLPYFNLFQSQANRLLDEWKKNHPANEEEKDKDEQEPPTTPNDKDKPKGEQTNDIPSWAKSLLKGYDDLKKEVTAINAKNTSVTRASRLEAILKDTGSFGKQMLKSFSKMKFESDEDFDEYLEDVQQGLKDYNQERANDGLSLLGKPSTTNGGNPKKEEPLTDAEVDELAKLYN